MSLKVAPVPWIDSAVARRSGKRFDSEAAAVGCHNAVPRPISAEPTNAQVKTGTPNRK